MRLFTSSDTGKFSTTKTLAVLVNFLSVVFLIVLIIADWKGHPLSQSTIDYAKTILGVGSPVSLVTYLVNRLNERKALATIKEVIKQ